MSERDKERNREKKLRKQMFYLMMISIKKNFNKNNKNK